MGPEWLRNARVLPVRCLSHGFIRHLAADSGEDRRYVSLHLGHNSDNAARTPRFALGRSRSQRSNPQISMDFEAPILQNNGLFGVPPRHRSHTAVRRTPFPQSLPVAPTGRRLHSCSPSVLLGLVQHEGTEPAATHREEPPGMSHKMLETRSRWAASDTFVRSRTGRSRYTS